jgi:hypothetical protein
VEGARPTGTGASHARGAGAARCGRFGRKNDVNVDEAFTVTIHPGVAEGGRADAGPEFQAAVDEELAATWRTVMRRGLETYTKERSAGLMIVRAGLAAFPYLSRLQNWEMAAKMIEEVVQIDQTPEPIAKLGWRGELLGFEG